MRDSQQHPLVETPLLKIERELWEKEGADVKIAGVDEAGRGPLAGPVVAAAVILPICSHDFGDMSQQLSLSKIKDSKALSAPQRDTLAQVIRASCMWSVAEVDVLEIDELNIHNASLLAMRRALSALPYMPDVALIDGKFIPECSCRAQAVVKGDARSLSIAAASILAKTVRDEIMIKLDAAFPGYGWSHNKGYPSQAHREALMRLGVTSHHRRSYKPVQEALTTHIAHTHSLG